MPEGDETAAPAPGRVSACDRVLAALHSSGRAGVMRAPGRVNLMGDHTDYNEGFVLPLAIELECVAAFAPREDGRVIARSLDVEGPDVDVAADGSVTPADATPPWGRYVAGVVAGLAERGRPAVGAEIALTSSVPSGSGLSSSAALEVACALALLAVAEWELPVAETALACQRAEQLATAVPSGIMDQLASLTGRAGHALVIDCRSLSREPVPLPDDLAVVVVHSGMPRTLEASAYAERRAACEELATRLGLPALRDATLAQVGDSPIGRHVVTENARVGETAAALRAGDAEVLAELFAASHKSLRDDYRVSTPELDRLVGALVEAGAIGARMTGAGFGGAVVALAPAEAASAIGEDGAARYARETGREPTVWVTRAADGAGPLGDSHGG